LLNVYFDITNPPKLVLVNVLVKFIVSG